MKRVYKKSYLIILAALIAVCCALAAVFARGAVAHADIDNADTIYWGFGLESDGSLYGGDYKLILSDDNDNVIDSESFSLYKNGSFSSDAVFENAESVPWSEYNQGIGSLCPFYLLEIIGDVAPVSTAYWFAWSPCRVLDLSGLDTSRLTNMSSMFFACNYLESLDLSGFDTSNIPDMSEMFAGCEKLTTLDLSGWDTLNVTDMSGMFDGCSSMTELDVSCFDTSNVTDMSYMFRGCSSMTELDVSGFDTSNVTDMSGMFVGCNSLTELDVSGFDTSNVTDMSYMFSGCSSLTDIGLPDFDIESGANVPNVEGMLSGLTALETITIDEGMADIMSRFDTGLGKTLYIDCISFEPAEGRYTGLEADTYSTTAAEHVLELVEAVEATCQEDGNVEYYHCSVCEKNFSDEEGLTEIEEEDIIIHSDPTKHDWQHFDRVPPTETEVGYTEHEVCSICGETQGKEEIPATGKTPGTGTGSGSTNSGTNKNNLSNKTVLILLCCGVALVTLMAILALILAIKTRSRGGSRDDDGFYDTYYGSY